MTGTLLTTGAYASTTNKASLNPNQGAIVRELKNPDNNSYFAENSIDAVVLAGQTPVLDLNTDYKATIDIDGKEMIWYVVEAALESKYVDNVYIVGVEDKLNKINFSGEKEKIKFVNEKGNFLDDFIQGGNASETKKILYLTCDIPLIEKEHIDEFIEACAKRGEADFYLPYCLEEEDKRKFPEIEPNYVLKILGEGYIRSAYILVLDRNLLDEINKNKDIKTIIASLDSTREKRKRLYLNLVIKHLSLSSLKCFIQYKRGTLTIAGAEEFLSKLTRKNIVLIKGSSELGTDINSYEDLKNIEEIIKKNKSYIKTENVL